MGSYIKQCLVALVLSWTLIAGCAVDRIGLVQSALVTATIDCDKCRKGDQAACKDNPCKTMSEKKAELIKLLN